jgi:hypothetical protein
LPILVWALGNLCALYELCVDIPTVSALRWNAYYLDNLRTLNNMVNACQDPGRRRYYARCDCEVVRGCC